MLAISIHHNVHVVSIKRVHNAETSCQHHDVPHLHTVRERQHCEDEGQHHGCGLRRDDNADVEVNDPAAKSETPEELIGSAYQKLHAQLRAEVLDLVHKVNPFRFERLVLDLLLAMGYGGSRADAGEQLGGTGDGGVDGVIREDQLGLDRVYLQAKRYQPAVNELPSKQIAINAFLSDMFDSPRMNRTIANQWVR